MKKRVTATLACLMFFLSAISEEIFSIEDLRSEVLLSVNLETAEQLSYETIESDYIQTRNTIRRYNGCWNKYYSLGIYKYKGNSFEILLCTNGYTTFTYLVAKKGDEFPKMLLIDMRTGAQVDVSFKISKGLIHLSYIEHCAEFPVTNSETYRLDSEFSVVESQDKPPFKEVNVVPE
jgi:hypothetical protein